jgi:acyl-CoA thioesterase FadM
VKGYTAEQATYTSVEMQPYEFRTSLSEEEVNSIGPLFLPRHIEEKCWTSFVQACDDDLLEDESEEEYVFQVFRYGCNHSSLIIYPAGPITIQMHVYMLTAFEVHLGFEHLVDADSLASIVARGEQNLVCLRRFGDRLLPAEWPEKLRRKMNEIVTVSKEEVERKSVLNGHPPPSRVLARVLRFLRGLGSITPE